MYQAIYTSADGHEDPIESIAAASSPLFDTEDEARAWIAARVEAKNLDVGTVWGHSWSAIEDYDGSEGYALVSGDADETDRHGLLPLSADD